MFFKSSSMSSCELSHKPRIIKSKLSIKFIGLCAQFYQLSDNTISEIIHGLLLIVDIYQKFFTVDLEFFVKFIPLKRIDTFGIKL